jgi:hypothetical protein
MWDSEPGHFGYRARGPIPTAAGRVPRQDKRCECKHPDLLLALFARWDEAELYISLFRHTRGHTGTLWDTLGHSGTLWDTLGHTGTHWDTLGQGK